MKQLEKMLAKVKGPVQQRAPDVKTSASSARWMHIVFQLLTTNVHSLSRQWDFYEFMENIPDEETEGGL